MPRSIAERRLRRSMLWRAQLSYAARRCDRVSWVYVPVTPCLGAPRASDDSWPIRHRVYQRQERVIITGCGKTISINEAEVVRYPRRVINPCHTCAMRNWPWPTKLRRRSQG